MLFFFRLEPQTHRVDTKTFTTIVLGAVIEQVPKVCTACFACHFGSRHAHAGIIAELDMFHIDRIGEAWPSGSGIKLCVGGEQLCAAYRTRIHPLRMLVPVFSREWRFSPLFACNMVQIRIEMFIRCDVGLVFHVVKYMTESSSAPLPLRISLSRFTTGVTNPDVLQSGTSALAKLS